VLRFSSMREIRLFVLGHITLIAIAFAGAL
jgi:hypothetical protein